MNSGDFKNLHAGNSNKAYKKWIIQEGKTPAGMVDLFVKCLEQKHKMAMQIYQEAGLDKIDRELEYSDLKVVIEMILKQLKINTP